MPNSTFAKIIHVLFLIAADPAVRADVSKFAADVLPILTAAKAADTPAA